MRDRAWRRHIRERVIIMRIRKYNLKSYWYRLYQDANGYDVDKPKLTDYIGSKETRYYSNGIKYYRRGSKYSPNKSHNRKYRSWGRPGDTPDTREFQRRVLIKIKQEYGLK
jgi:hypothetical protein